MTVQNPTRQDIQTKIIARALKDEAFKETLLNNPDAAKAEVEKELGQNFPENFKVQVVQETENVAYLVLPIISSAEGELSEEELEQTVSGCLWQSCDGSM